MDSTERWRPAVGWEGFYEVSDRGQVRGVPRTITYRDGRSWRHPGGPVKSRDDRGYRKITLSRDGTRQHAYVHDLVLCAFVSPRPPGKEACHGPAGSAENGVENLRWGTSTENNRDIIEHGNCWQLNRTHCPAEHPLVEPNLVAAKLAKGQRTCKACSRAFADCAYARRCGRVLDFRAAADRQYARIMGEAA